MFPQCCSILLLLASARVGLAQQYSSPSSAPASQTSSVPAATHTVSVGAEGHRFSPETITANVGDIVEYRFYPLNHSVARADYRAACIPYEFSGPGRTGFWSKFFPIAVIPTSPPTFQVRVNDTNPVFFYCSAPGACEDGMVGVINPSAAQTLAVQKLFAANSSYAFSPGENFPAEVRASVSSSIAAATATAATSTPPTSTPTAAAVANHGLSTGAIAGIAIGGAAVIVLAGALIYLCGRQRTLAEIVQKQNSRSPGSHPSPTFIPGHMSMASTSTAPMKSPRYDANNLGPQRYSVQGGGYSETESYRSRSPAIDERGEFVLPMNLGPNGSSSPLMMQEAPPGVGPLRVPTSPHSMHHPASAEVPIGMMLQRGHSQYGPHELPVEGNQTATNTPPYHGFDYKNAHEPAPLFHPSNGGGRP
ncbi:hypothetical protein BJ875DRAFT_493761 [Amylocarpus encephaloides]|uniref:Extracellular serine-rich protein n=1 Tax=Amylocarpus encephaloides TaxID=45428 RepID=A0A9P8C7J6_9HELO|nr:hypothetical protein BJ875DRAFT_493761 [Amylocarpus encephaloides]